MLYTADFETTVDPDDCRVWAYSLCTIDDEYITSVGESIDEMFESLKGSNTLYFHNLKFDGEFLLYWLFKNGYKHVQSKKELKAKTFTTLISDRNVFYTIKICHAESGRNKITTTIIDSLKILNFSVDEVAKAFNLPISKLTIDYKKYRPIGYHILPEEKEYCIHDVKIMAMALKVLFDEGLTKMTQGSDAMADYKQIVGDKKFNEWFPELSYEVDKDIRQAYKGGFTYLNPRFCKQRTWEYKRI